MTYHTLISTADLSAHLGDPGWIMVDCRFSLARTERGRQDYQAGHIPGAVYCHLNEDLSGPVISGTTGRHPLPPVNQLVAAFSRWGISPEKQVVAYDDWPGASGAIAARLWWSLRWLGHTAVAVLDGGWRKWINEERPLTRGIESNPNADFKPRINPGLLAETAQVDKWRRDSHYRIFDSRTADRYRGENETIDPVAGHIPGAFSAPFMDNMGPDGCFLSEEALNERFTPLFDGILPGNAVFYCGSGVTAAHNILAAVHAGFHSPRLYAGSWSEWITDPSRPVATGSNR